MDRAKTRAQAIQDKYNQELSEADARLAERIAKRRQEEEIQKNIEETMKSQDQDSELSPQNSSIVKGQQAMEDTVDDSHVVANDQLVTPSVSQENVEHLTEEEQRKRDQEMNDEAFARELQAQLDQEAALDLHDKKTVSSRHIVDDEDIDPELQAIAKAAKLRNQLASGKPKQDSGEKPLSEMTREEKLEWLAKKRAENRKRVEQKKIDDEKEKYQNKKNFVHAQMDVQERLETIHMKEAASIKAKENREKALRMAKLREKEAQEKARRKADAEKRAAEIERIRAEKAAAAKK